MRTARTLTSGLLLVALALFLAGVGVYALRTASSAAYERQAEAAANLAAAQAAAQSQVAQTQAALEQDRLRQEHEIARARADQWRAMEAAWIAPMWGLFSATVPAVLSLALLLALGIVADAYWQRRRPLVEPDRRGLLPVERGQLGGLTAVAIGLLEQHQQQQGQTQLAGASRPVLPQHYAPHITIKEERAPAPAPALPQPVAEAPGLPGPVDLGAVVERASLDNILLALGPGGAPITVKAQQLCHVALAGATGGGKSNLMRLLLAQLLAPSGADGKALARVVLCDPHFAPYDPESGDDWRPIASRLHMAPAIAPSAIDDTLRWLAFDELPRRLELRRQGQKVGPPIFLAIDELPAIVEDTPKAPEYMGRVLREGRKVGLFIIGAAQDWLVKSVGGAGAIRDCYRTSYYVGGDTTSARVLLDITGRVDDGNLGQGLAMLRSAATPQAQTVRVPYASNNAISQLLPWVAAPTSTHFQQREVGTSTPTSGPLPWVVEEVGGEVVIEVPTSGPQLDARAARVKQMLMEQASQNEIIKAVWGVSGGTSYQKAADEYRAIVARLIGGAV
jgi:hypothetical protein